MEDNNMVPVPRDEYAALCALQGKVYSFEAMARKNRYMSIDDALVILGFEPIEDEKDAGEPHGD